jgi:hypothetical protein
MGIIHKSREKNSEVFLQNKYGEGSGSVELVLDNEISIKGLLI